jgi:carboxyl-terminal processing protease
MKKILALALLLSLTMAAQNNDKACGIFSKVNAVLQTRHYKPKPIDDSLSVYVFNTVMESLDDNRMYFLQEDLDLLAKHKYKIDDYLTSNQCDFFSDFISVYKKALERNKKNIEEIGLQKFSFNTKDTLFYSRKSYPFHKTAEKQKNFIRKKIVHDILEDVAKLSKNKDSLKVKLDAIGKTSKTKIIDAYLCKTNSLLTPSEGFENSIYNRFFSTLCTYFDPHSDYFSYNDKASFLSSISTENYSLGLVVSQNEKEEVVVEEIVPGGPAYKTKKVDKGDQLLKLAVQGKEYSVNCASMETITDIVLSDTYKNVTLTLRKNDGTVYTVSLEKTKMKAEDHSVYSFIIGEGNDRMGYIKIPSFYTAEGNSIKGCADDVAKEVSKLKKDNIKGLIIDLQFNGGGSMDEVIKLSGMFIDFGPLSVVVDKNKMYNTLRDYNRGSLYNGPMVVLVNGFSASASEFFAGVMQDYNRAVIAGNTTLGKATMQTILPLEGSEQDFVKVTIDRFYRVTGKSSQYTGIVPDIQMPVFFERFLPRESSMPNAMKNDSIAPHLKYRPLPAEPIKQIAEMSRKRIDANADFIKIKSLNTVIEGLYGADKSPLALNFDAVFADVHSMDDIWKTINISSEKEQDLTVHNTTVASQAMMNDEYLKNSNEHKIKSVKSDPYIYEGLNILKDLTSLRNQ